MNEFVAHRLRFECQVESEILLSGYQGSAIRGALFHALRGRESQPGLCFEPRQQECRGCPYLPGCPVSLLLATVDENGRRGSDVPRPYTIEPPLRFNGRYEVGETFEFGLTLFARALSLFPYVIVAVRRMEGGIGRRIGNAKGRSLPGRFRIGRIVATNPLTGQEQAVMQSGEELVAVPSIPITHEQVINRARELALHLAQESRLVLEFLTPTRLFEGGRQMRRPELRVLMHRLIERLSSLWEEYGGGELPINFQELMQRSAEARLTCDETRWVEVRGYSTRQGAPKWLDGFVGRAIYEGVAAPLLPWLVWGEVTHVGKDAVKGCGWYRMSAEPKICSR